jgi:opacity protein-like surface antigen
MGASLDRLSMNLFKFNCTEGCEDKLNLDPNANFDFSMPINYGIGIGIEYPLSQKLDLSIDIGYRYLSYGNSTIINGFISPINENTNAFVFRIGITY